LRYVDDRSDLAADVARVTCTAQVLQIKQAQRRVLAALHGQMLILGNQWHRKNGGSRAADVGIRAVEGCVIRRRVAVDRFASIGTGTTGGIGMQRDDRFTPVEVAVELPRRAAEGIAGAHENAVGAGVVDDARARPNGILVCGTGRRHATAESSQVRGLVAARSVEDILRACRKVDRRNVALVVAVVAGVSAMRHVEVSRAGGHCE
jgi:hypothetical protein